MAKKKGRKRKSRILVFLSMMIFAAIGITIAYAAINMHNTATNVTTVGHVKIELINEDNEEVNLYNKEEGFQNTHVMPGDKIFKSVTVKNTGEYAACIRVKVKKEWEWRDTSKCTGSPIPAIPTITPGAITLTLEDKNLDSTENGHGDWRLGKGEDSRYDYYYYQGYVGAGKEVAFMDHYFVDSEKMNNDQMDPNVMGKITIEAEAVQADYYAYDIEGNLLEHNNMEQDKNDKLVGWKNVTFGPDFTNAPYVTNVATGSAVTGSAVSAGAVTFEGDSGDFVNFPNSEKGNDFFINIKGMMPGETRMQTIEINNVNTNSNLRVYMFSTKPEEIKPGSIEEQLLRTLKIRISKWERHIQTSVSANSGGSRQKKKVMSLGYRNSSIKQQGFQKTAGEVAPQSTWDAYSNFSNLFDDNINGVANFLGEFSHGEKARMTVEIYLPDTWEHPYCETSVNWTFITEKDLITSPPYYPPTQPPIPTRPPTPQPDPASEEPPTVPPVVTPSLEPTPEKTVEPTDNPINADSPTEAPEPTPKPMDTPSPLEPTPTFVEFGGDDNPMATVSSVPVPSKTPKPVPAQTPKKTKKPATPKPTKNPEGTANGDIPKIDVTPNLPEESATKTGDDTPIFFWSVVCLVSLLGVLYNGIVLGKKKE